MSLYKKVLFISSLLLIKVVTTACDMGSSSDDYSSGSSGSSSSSYSLLPKYHSPYPSCDTQWYTFCQGADSYYSAYVECMEYNNGASLCNQNYDPAYVYYADMCVDYCK